MKDKLKKKMTNRQIISWQKRFVLKDEQENEIDYYYQSNLVFNIIKPFILKLMNSDVKQEYIWGKNSIVATLIPYQIEYNIAKNKYIDMLNRLTLPIVMVEDGSVDVDALCEDGIAPGKVLVYRQGSLQPSIQSTITRDDVAFLYSICDDILNRFNEECDKIYDLYTNRLI